MDTLDSLVKAFSLRLIEKRELDGDVSIACYTSGKFVDLTRITTVDLTSLHEMLSKMNKQNGLFACSVISTADRKEKVVCFTCDPHGYLQGRMSQMFSSGSKHTYQSEKEEVKSIEDAVRQGFAPLGLDVIASTQEEAFDDTGATCFMDLVFSRKDDRLIFDLDHIMTHLSLSLAHLNLDLTHLELHDMHGEWNHMRICLTVEKIPMKSTIFTKEKRIDSDLKGHTANRDDGIGQVILFLLLSLAITAFFVTFSQSVRERVLHILF